MRVVIDTSSLMALVRYYLPFEKGNSLKDLFQQKIETGEIIVLDKVFEESTYISKGIITKELKFLKNKLVKTSDILPYPKFFNQLENQLCYGVLKNRLNSIEFENERNKFLETADAKQILYCLKDNNSLEFDKPILVTEETKVENDKKLFKKIPEICSILNIESCNLPALLKNHLNIKLSEFTE